MELEEFCRRAHAPLVAAFAHRFGDRWLAEELAQEALVRACQSWRRVRGLESPIGWAYRVGVNLGTSHFRRRLVEQRVRALRGSVDEAVVGPDPTDWVVVHAALRSLTPQQRDAVVLRYFLDLSSEQTAAVLHTTAGAVRGLTHRALGALRAVLDVNDLEEASDAV